LRILAMAASAAAMLFASSNAQAARTVTLTVDAYGKGFRVVGYSPTGMGQTVPLVAASVSVVLTSNDSDPNYFFGGEPGSYINVYFGPDAFSLFMSPPQQSYYAFDGSATVCTANGPIAGAFQPASSCKNSNTLSYSSSITGGYGERFEGSIASYSIEEGNTLGGSNLRVSAVVPEPSTWALMFAGFALTAYAMRRRRMAYA